MDSEYFWQRLDTLVASLRLKIDRPKGSTHPRYPDFVYPMDYGYLEGTRACDGGGIDVWVGSLSQEKVTGIVCTVDLQKLDSEMKVLLGCTPQEARAILAIHNDGSQSAILIERPGEGQ